MILWPLEPQPKMKSSIRTIMLPPLMLDIYTHVTDTMQAETAAKIDQGIGKAAPQELPAEPQAKRTMTTFQPYMGKKRKPGTGYIGQKGPNLWEGRYSPTWIDGKKHASNVYAHTREECEEKLKELIIEMKAELEELKRKKAEERCSKQSSEGKREKARKNK